MFKRIRTWWKGDCGKRFYRWLVVVLMVPFLAALGVFGALWTLSEIGSNDQLNIAAGVATVVGLFIQAMTRHFTESWKKDEVKISDKVAATHELFESVGIAFTLNGAVYFVSVYAAELIQKETNIDVRQLLESTFQDVDAQDMERLFRWAVALFVFASYAYWRIRVARASQSRKPKTIVCG